MKLGWEPLWRKHGAAWELREPELRVVEFAKRLKREGGERVHDLGCGLGRHLLLFAAEGFETYGSDVSPTAVGTCERRLQESGLKAEVTQTEMSAIPQTDASLDAVIAWNVLYHACRGEVFAAIAGIRNKLKPRGYLLATFISTADGQYERSSELVAEGRAEELEPRTFVIPGDTATDKALPHHYSSEVEISEQLLEGFEILQLEEDRSEGGVDFEGRPYPSAHWLVLARKER